MQQQQQQQKMMQMQQMQRQMQQQQQPQPEKEQPSELRTAAGGFARFAKRLGTDSSSSVFMWVSIVLVFILIGFLIAMACKSSAAPPAAAALSVPEYPF